LRSLFGFDGPLTKEQVYARIDESMKGTHFYRLKLSTDPRKEDWDKQLDLQEVTRSAIRELELQLKSERGQTIQLDFVAAMHDDHTAIRHVHILAFVPGRLNRNHLQALKVGATAEALEQRDERDKAFGIGRAQTAERPQPVQPLPPRKGRSDQVGTKPGTLWVSPEAPDCPRCDTQMAFMGTHCVCSGCGLKFAIEPELMLGREADRVW
jgi:hypothetical protein